MADSQDAPRLLTRSGVPGSYTHVAMLAMSREPEAVSEEEQWLISEKARRLHDDTLRAEWRKASGRITEAVSHFEKTSRPPQDLGHQLRAVRRTVGAIDKRFDA